MKRREFRELIQHLELLAKQAPTLYRLRLTALAMLGYLYLFFVLLLLAGVLGLVGLITWAAFVKGKAGAIAIQVLLKLGLPAALLAWFVIRAFWVRIPPPEGRILQPHEAPKLFQLIEEIRVALESPRIHAVLLTHDFNAGIFQWPRLGVLGWQKNFLILGFPLLACLTPQQFRAVLAHEFGHLSGRHGTFSNWIYRLRSTWGQLLTTLVTQENGGSWLFNRFITWFAPYFDAYAFVIGREHEYEADRLSATLVGKEMAQQTLIAVCVMSRFLDEAFWPNLNQLPARQAEPPHDVYSSLLRHLGNGVDPEKAASWIKETLQLKTDIDDTHPALADRLAALAGSRLFGLSDLAMPEIRLRRPDEPAAGNFYLAEFMETWSRELDTKWLEAVQEEWKKVHEQGQTELKELEELRAKAVHTDLDEDDAWKLVAWTGQHEGDEKARPLLMDFLRRFPEHPWANHTYGRILLGEKDGRGEGYLTRAMERSHDLVIPGCEVLAAYYHQLGRDDQAEHFRERIEAQSELYEQAQIERNVLQATDKLLPHNLDEETLAGLAALVRPHPEIIEGYVVRKALQHFPEEPCYLVGILVQHPFWTRTFSDTSQKNIELVQLLANEARLPGHFIAFVIEKELKPLHEPLRQIHGARFHPPAHER